MAFVAFSRLGCRKILGTQTSLLKAYNVPALTAATAALQESQQRTGESHDEKNTRLSRPMSPHLTIYKYEMTMVLSISHRITGCALALYSVGFAGAALTATNDFSHCIAAIEALNPGSLTLMTGKFMLAFPLMYHTCNGVRHLMWDTGNQLNKKAVVTTGSVMLVAALATTILAML